MRSGRYANWPGYLDRGGGRLASWCRERALALDIAHSSGPADRAALVRLTNALNSEIVVSIHTQAPHVMGSLVSNVRVLADGAWARGLTLVGKPRFSEFPGPTLGTHRALQKKLYEPPTPPGGRYSDSAPSESRRLGLKLGK